MPYVNVWVDDTDVLEDASDEDLVNELRKRNLPDAAETDEAKEDLNRIFYAFYFGKPDQAIDVMRKPDQAIDVMRKYVQDVTGRTLP